TCWIGRGGKGAHLVRKKHGRKRTRIDVASRAAGGIAANSHRPASRAADRADPRHHRRDGDGRLRTWRRHDECLAFCRFTRRICRLCRDRIRWLWADQSPGAHSQRAPGLASGECRAALGDLQQSPQACLAPPFPPTIGPRSALEAPIETHPGGRPTMREKIMSAVVALLALGIGGAGSSAQAEPLKIRGAWVAPLANLASVWLQKK